jgi:hypothetical protein
VTDEQKRLVTALAESYERQAADEVGQRYGFSEQGAALRACLAAAAKPPVVVGLSEKERNAVEISRFFVAAYGGGKKEAFKVLDTLDDMLDRDPNECAVVRKADLANVVDLAVVLLDGQACDAARGSSLEDLGRLVGVEVFTPAIAKEREQ